MQRTTVHQSQGLAGTERYGAVHGTDVAAILPSYIQEGTQPAAPSGVAYHIKYETCTAETDSGKECMAARAKGTKFCAGHLRKMGLLEKKEKPVQE